MSENPRDEQFQGFARLLWEEIFNEYNDLECSMDELAQRIQIRIAKRLYDFQAQSCIAINNAQIAQGARLHPSAMLRAVPDMIAWPKEVRE